ncbi:MAG: hypothetical protein ACREK9_09295 [Candidatus Rokuibacteriota bacterium]
MRPGGPGPGPLLGICPLPALLLVAVVLAALTPREPRAGLSGSARGGAHHLHESAETAVEGGDAARHHAGLDRTRMLALFLDRWAAEFDLPS